MFTDLTTVVLTVVAALLAALGYFIKRILDKAEALERDLKPLTPAIVEIQGKFSEAGHKLLFPLTVTPGSPLQLTEYGSELMEQSGFFSTLDEYGDELVKRVKAKKPKTNYDIQQSSIEVIAELLDKDDPIGINLKDFAFNSGLLIDVLVLPAGITLRDRVMETLKF